MNYMTSEVRFRVCHNLFKILVGPPLSLLIVTLAHPPPNLFLEL